MPGIDGTYALGPDAGELRILTTRTGLGRRAGHDLTIEATGWQGRAHVDTANPANSEVSLDIEVNAFAVREGTGGLKPLTNDDRAEIMHRIRDEILHAERYPTIGFRSTGVSGSADAFTIEGELTITGVTQPVTVTGAVDDGRVRGSATVQQTQWGIKPYSAFFGALRLADEVTVEFDVALRAEL